MIWFSFLLTVYFLDLRISYRILTQKAIQPVVYFFQSTTTLHL